KPGPGETCRAQPVRMINGPKATETAKPSVVRNVNWENFRDHIATADKEGRRKWIFSRRPRGPFYRWRTWFSWLLLAVLFTCPFVTVGGEPLLLANVVERKFAVLGRIFWPQDALIL